MRVGITYRPSQSVDSGWNQTAVALGELFAVLGDSVVLVSNQAPAPFPFPTAYVHETDGLDLLIDIDGLLDRRPARHAVVFLRTFLQFTEMDASVYLETLYRPRSFDGVREIWCWDILNPEATIPSIQTLFPCPLRRVPFVWSSTITEKAMGHRVSRYNPDKEVWCVHVAEQNQENTSSSVLPLVAIRELCLQRETIGMRAEFFVHNLDAIKDSRFLKENVLDNIEVHTLSVSMKPRESYDSWLDTDNTMLLSHSRFVPLPLGLLNALWMGIPVVHNSPVLRDLHEEVGRLFYHGNDIRAICRVFVECMNHPERYYSHLSSIREAIQRRFGVKASAEAWSTILQGFRTESVGAPVAPAVAPTVAPAVVPAVVPATLRIAFTDMWPGFHPDSNFLLDALRHHLKRPMVGLLYDASGHDLLVFGPYSQNWKSIPGPKVYFSAENWTLPQDDSIVLYLTSSLKEDATHLRIPTWMTFIDWFSGSTSVPTNLDDNPIRFPLHFATTPHPCSFTERSAFCAFVVSNPCCTFRNESFHAVNRYKTVNSGGALYNTIGGLLALKYPGGGCGDVSKHEFFRTHRFTLSMENSQAPGYVTEKLLHAKMAGCVPLYWGSSTDDFAPNSYVDLSACTEGAQVVEVVKMLEQREAACATMAATPLLDAAAVSKARATMRKMCDALSCYLPSSTLPGINEVYVINLDTRVDRWTNLMAAHPELKPLVTRVAGVNGKTVTMTAEMYHLFEKNEFQWKKSIIGCNLSHISVWKRIAEMPVGSLALVLEDDVRFTEGWQKAWAKAVTAAPSDADVLYLGGVLPPNQAALPLASEGVNAFWSRIVPNRFFSSEPCAVFHFCAYSYVLTQRGAAKLMAYLQDSSRRSFTVSDHLLGHPDVGLVKYHSRPLLTHCFQESDPVYRASAFDELHRKDTFDSDIWNNTECFSEAERAPFVPVVPVVPLVVPSVKELVLYYMDASGKPFQPYEATWLHDIFPPHRFVLLENVQLGHHSWFVVQRPYLPQYLELFQQMEKASIPFHVLHMSDEFGQDDLSFYSLSMCQSVLRNYVRDCPSPQKVHLIPLGYHHRYRADRKAIAKRELVWSFHGTDWFDRAKQLAEWISFVPYRCNLQPHWNHPTATREALYLSQLGNSRFCPILKGQHAETFRFYEALEAGTMPITTISDETWLAWVEQEMGLSSLYTWREPERVLATGVSAEVQEEVGKRWQQWKERVVNVVTGLVQLR